MIDDVDLNEALNDIQEVEILEVIVGRDVQLLQEVVLYIEVVPELLRPPQGTTQFKHEVWEVTDLHEAGTL